MTLMVAFQSHMVPTSFSQSRNWGTGLKFGFPIWGCVTNNYLATVERALMRSLVIFALQEAIQTKC